jgi:hypothetical protein
MLAMLFSFKFLGVVQFQVFRYGCLVGVCVSFRLMIKCDTLCCSL